jgi:hypothetical protein
VRVPVAAAVNVTLMVQLAPGLIELPQLFVCAKSPGFVPVMAMLVIETIPFGLTFVTVTICAALVVPTVWLPEV